MTTYELSISIQNPPNDLHDGEQFLALADQVYSAFHDSSDEVEVEMIRGALRIRIAHEDVTMTATLTHVLRKLSILGLRVGHLGPESLVSASQIAQRLKLTRERVGQLLQAGELPAPLAALDERSPLYRWSDVVAHLRDAERLDDTTFEAARAIERANAALTLFEDQEEVIQAIATPMFA